MRKIQLALIGSRPRAFQLAIDEPCTLPLSPPKGGSKKNFTFGIALHFFVARNRRHFKHNMWVEHSKSQHTDDKIKCKDLLRSTCVPNLKSISAHYEDVKRDTKCGKWGCLGAVKDHQRSIKTVPFDRAHKSSH